MFNLCHELLLNWLTINSSRIDCCQQFNIPFMPTAKQIEKELGAIERGEARTWGQVAVLLDEIDSCGYWHRDADSFTEWLGKHAHIFGVKPAMLWRHLTSGRYLKQLRDSAAAKNVSVPSLDLLPNSVSSESVELLAKLERIMPEADFQKLLARMLEGGARRAELRSLWEAYRPVLGGKTARGRGVVVPRINRDDPEQYQSLMEANFLSALKAAGSAWTGAAKPERYEVYLHVTPEGKVAGRKILFPAVAMVKPKDGALEYHAVLFAPFLDRFREFLENLRVFPDYLWVIPRTSLRGGLTSNIHLEVPRGIGLITIESGAVHVIVPAERMPESGSRRADLASALLVRSSKR